MAELKEAKIRGRDLIEFVLSDFGQAFVRLSLRIPYLYNVQQEISRDYRL